MKNLPLTRFLSNPRYILFLYILLAVVFSLLNVKKGETKVFSGDKTYTYYNNYVIFKNAYYHLKQGADLYILYPDKQWDLYKYSPTFAATMVVLAYMPDWLGLVLWNLINVLILFYGIRYFIKGPPVTIFILWFICNELITSIMNSQSNPMIAGLLAMAFTCFEKQKVHWAALFIVSTFYIKVFGILAALLFLFYPQKGKFMVWCLVWSAVLFILPLVFIYPMTGSNGLDTLIWQYNNWLRLLSEDHSGSLGYSFMGVLHSWFGVNSGKDLLVIVGLACLVIPFVFVRKFNDLNYRIHWFASLLIWLVIFNHKAESPTFIIAFTGIGLWVFTSPKNAMVISLAVLAFVFTSLAPTDLFPATIRRSFFEPYAIKAVPCILIWTYITVGLVREGLNPKSAFENADSIKPN